MSDFSIQQAARREGVSTRTIRRWIAQGLLPAARLGPRLVRINSVDLDRLTRPIPVGEASQTGSGVPYGRA